MSILGSLYSAVSGLGAHGDAIDVVSDNIANLNTIGFKAGRGRFEDIMGNVEGVSLGAGLGTRLADVQQIFEQGSLLGTGISTDLAIEGDGFFIVDGAFGGVNGTFYSRSGEFNLDANGRLINAQGLAVQGYQADALGVVGTTISDLLIPPTSTVPPNATTQIDLSVNLDSSATTPAAFSLADPSGTSNFSTSVVVYDSLGGSHDVDVYFRNAGAGSWEWFALVDGAEITAGTPGTPVQTANGTLGFTTNGFLDTEATAATDFDFLGATQNQAIAFDFGDSITTDSGTGQSGTTGYAEPSSVTLLSQDGFSSGSLIGMAVAEDGSIEGAFSNGERRVLGQVALARFRNTQGLNRSGAGLFSISEASGLPLVGTASTGGRGSVAGGALEQSNVDLAEEFVNLIAYQRGFQANSRTVTTADEMLQELVNIV